MRDGTLIGERERDTLDMLLVALCADFERRAAAISNHSVSARTEAEYRYLNYKITAAAREIVTESQAHLFIKEIGERLGYVKSELYYMSESSYKQKKQQIKQSIARALHLKD